jgi:stage III sporulation protein AH
MFVLKRNQVIITALVIMIAVAGFLTWQDTRQPESIGYLLTPTGEIAALIPDGQTLTGLFGDDYNGVANLPWTVTHDPTIALGYDYARPALAGLDTGYTPDDSEAGEAIFVNRSLESSFFVQARLNREQGRSQERAILTELINNNNIEPEQRARAADEMIEIQSRIQREAAAESLIESKGFSEVYVRIGNERVDVIVSKEELSPGELAQIMDIIKSKTSVAESNIFISPMRR